MVSQIYPSELQLNKANTSDTKAAFLDLNDIVSTKIYDKCDEFDFEIVNFSFLDGDVPRFTPYGVYISLSKFYRQYYDLISKFQVGLKSLLHFRNLISMVTWCIN